MTINMEWSNKAVLKFIKVFGTEPAIWDPNHPDHKKRHAISQAWQRIFDTLNWPCTVEDLKKKRDSLMAYYRVHVRKLKQTKQSGTSAEEDYKTNWFAFNAMNRYLGRVYDNIEEENNIETLEDSIFVSEYGSESEYQPSTSRQEQEENTIETLDATNSIYVSEYESEPKYIPKTSRQALVIETSSDINDISTKECEIYGQLLAHKLMKLNEEDRLKLMNKIDNLIFETTLKANAKK